MERTINIEWRIDRYQSRAVGLRLGDLVVLSRIARSGRKTFALAYDEGGRMFPRVLVGDQPLGEIYRELRLAMRGYRIARRLAMRTGGALPSVPWDWGKIRDWGERFRPLSQEEVPPVCEVHTLGDGYRYVVVNAGPAEGPVPGF